MADRDEEQPGRPEARPPSTAPLPTSTTPIAFPGGHLRVWKEVQPWISAFIALLLGLPTLWFSCQNYRETIREKRLNIRPRLEQLFRKGELSLDRPAALHVRNIGGVDIQTIEVEPYFYIFDFSSASYLQPRSIQAAGRLVALKAGEEGVITLPLDTGVRLMKGDIEREVARTGKTFRYAIVARLVTRYRRSVDYRSYQESSVLVLLGGESNFRNLRDAVINNIDPTTHAITRVWVNRDMAALGEQLETEVKKDEQLRTVHGVGVPDEE